MYSATLSLMIGIMGINRCLFPLPFTIMASDKGISEPSSAIISPIRNPQPYIRAKIALSRDLTQGCIVVLEGFQELIKPHLCLEPLE